MNLGVLRGRFASRWNGSARGVDWSDAGDEVLVLAVGSCLVFYEGVGTGGDVVEVELGLAKYGV